MGSTRLWTITAAHTHMASAAPGDSRVFCPDAEGQLIHTYTVTPTAALLPACCRRDSGSGTASASARASLQPSPHRCLVSWHHGLQILGLRQRACPRVCRQDTSQPLAHAATHHRGPASIIAGLQDACGQPSGQQSTVISTVASRLWESRALSTLESTVDNTDIATLAEAHPSSSEWRAAQSAALDRPGRLVAWRLLHGHHGSCSSVASDIYGPT